MIFPEIFSPYRESIFAGFEASPYDFNWNSEKTDGMSEISGFLGSHSLVPDVILNPQQTHSKIVYFSGGEIKKGTMLKVDADGVATSEKNILCMAKHADCIGAIFYNPLLEVGASIHAGWRGLTKKIFSEYLQNFSPKERSHFLVALSPSLGPCCAEFSNPYQETPEFFHKFIIKKTEKSEEKHQYYVNLWGIASDELQNMGVPEKNIELPLCCTKCNKTPQREKISQNFWSHRNKDSERGASFFMQY